ncbi:unnamed protein product [Dicrocoelium dendriticum]|nr:unnamed protein product [Dicrocoelium dendriticum]
MLPVIAALQLFDGTSGVCAGAIRGAGLQLVSAAICICCLYLLAAPIELVLVFVLGYQLEGIWIGFAVGAVSQAVAYCIASNCVDWKKQVELAHERTRDVSVSGLDDISLNGCGSSAYQADGYDNGKLIAILT